MSNSKFWDIPTVLKESAFLSNCLKLSSKRKRIITFNAYRREAFGQWSQIFGSSCASEHRLALKKKTNMWNLQIGNQSFNSVQWLFRWPQPLVIGFQVKVRRVCVVLTKMKRALDVYLSLFKSTLYTIGSKRLIPLPLCGSFQNY